MKNITAKRSRARIVDKLLALGLVAERRELYKKRRKKSAPSGSVMTSPKCPGSSCFGCSDEVPPDPRTPLGSSPCLLSPPAPTGLQPNGEEAPKGFCQEDLEEEENLSEEESEDDEEKEECSEAGQTLQGSSFPPSGNLGQSLRQEGAGWAGRGVPRGGVVSAGGGGRAEFSSL